MIVGGLMVRRAFLAGMKDGDGRQVPLHNVFRLGQARKDVQGDIRRIISSVGIRPNKLSLVPAAYEGAQDSYYMSASGDLDLLNLYTCLTYKHASPDQRAHMIGRYTGNNVEALGVGSYVHIRTSAGLVITGSNNLLKLDARVVLTFSRYRRFCSVLVVHTFSASLRDEREKS